MVSFLQNKYVQAIGIFAIIVGGYITVQAVIHQNQMPPIDLSGTHIMADGTVMTGGGIPLSDAKILPNGTIELSDGTILQPAVDLRPKEVQNTAGKSVTDNQKQATSEAESNTARGAPEGDSSEAMEMTNGMENTDDTVDYAGTHIMADGTVMTGSGTSLPDAQILSDGTIKLNDGTIITPAFDLRKKTEDTIPQADTTNQVIIDVVGTNFAYDVKEITVKKGEEVTINFTSAGGFHDWVLDEFEAATERVDEGEKTSVTFVADKVGTYQYYCSVKGHREKGQVGYLTVE